MNIQIFTAHMLLFKVVSSTECLSPNVRTVIWRNTDLYRSCWNDRDIAVLYARRLFQLILPIRVPSKMNHLVAHFKMCLEVVRDLATTKETHAMMVRPMADVIGGYLQSFAIPIANQEYYEGNLTYSTASQMNELLKGIKKILSTDGGKWTQPIRVLPSNEICAYQVIPPSPIENRCSELISSVDLRHKCKSEKELGWTSARVPLPFLDNSNTPQSIAVPFRTKTLYSLYDRDSSDILMRYYTAASHCYTTTCGAQGGITQEQRDFDRSFHDWILKSIVPHLHNGHWYPAFGGVYRILKHMTDEGFSFPDHQDAGPLAIQGRCLHQQVMAKTSWFFVACICGFLLMFWIVVCVVWRTRQKGRIVRIPDDNIITYNYHCDSEHSEDILKAIVKTIVEDSSADSFVEGVCNCQVSNDSICNCKDCNCVMPPQSQEDSQSLAA